MELRIRDKNSKIHTITTLNEQASFKELKEEISKLTGVLLPYQELKIGYPPRICKAKNEDTLASAGLLNGDIIILTEISSTEVVKGTPTISAPAPAPAHALHTPTVPSTASKSSSKDVISIPTENGFFILREMPDDNSCLFRAIGYVLDRSTDTVQHLRQIVIDHIRKNPDHFSDVVLGKPREEYCSWIARKDSWGGAIELSIFASHYKVEICSVDVRSGRIDRFGQGQYDQCVFVIYSGIHYDAIALTPILDAGQEYDQTIFNITDDVTLKAVSAVANKMKQLHKYTYTADFTLKCGQCGHGLKGEKEAVQHAQSTGHTKFVEYE
ncbi:OTU-domain-containing protein [Rhizophagus irregularis]|uniref:Ubiquitin thioesterase OTU n=2 Tax=Rhizophagus irregularis TaxID=588596 RepID=A0A2N1MRV7_9GLOM|nr:OTU-domain-containing protein [Rhizophagus irregularis]